MTYRTCLVYRQRYDSTRRTEPIEGLRFYLLDTPWSIAPVRRALLSDHGLESLLRLMAKLVAPFRLMYCAVENGVIMHEGWMVVGRSPLYQVNATDVVIGPATTKKEGRGRGIASFAIDHAMSTMRARGHDVFFAHAYEHNVASRRVIERCGFGPPVATMRLPDSRPRRTPNR